MYYAQIKNGIATELENALYAWDENNYCTPAALIADGKADQFGVVPVAFVSAPAHDPLTQVVIRDGCELVDGQWQYKWRVDQLSPEQVSSNQAAAATAEREAAKVRRAAAVAAITVTTAAGNTFDGDETSQTRMTRAIIALQATGTPSTPWVLHDNSMIEASATEFGEALALAGAAQSALWVLP